MLKVISFILFIPLLIGCTEAEEPIESAPIEQASVSFNVEYADHFKLSRFEGKIKLEIVEPESKKIEKSLLIEPSKDLKIISLTSTLNGMLSVLNKTDQLVGVSNIDYIHDQRIIDQYNKKVIIEYGDETTQSVEKIIASGADIIFHSGFGDSFPNEEQLEKLGIRVIPVYDWREENPLGKAEWIKLIGAITKSDADADSFFSNTVSEYNRLKKLANNLEKNPSVLSGNMLGDVWYTPVGDSYVAQLIKDAGGAYVYSDSKGTGSLALSIETILNDNDSTEFWINPGIDTKTKVIKMNPHAEYLNCFNNIYCYSPNMNLFWERSAVEPHLLLSDLIHIFHPEIKEIKEFNFYQRIN